MLKRFISLSLIFAMLAIAGCPKWLTADNIVKGLQAVSLIASAAGPIITPVNPRIGGLVTRWGKKAGDLANLYSQYESASATEKPGYAGQIHALTSTALQDLRIIYDDAEIKNQGLETEITAFVSAANTAIQALLTKLPSSTVAAQSAIMQTQALPTIPKAKSASDLKKAWNQAVGATHPEAMVK